MPNPAPPSQDPSIEDLVAAEIRPEEPVRRADPPRAWLVHPPRDLFGLALSGGGIRSATFNLGLLKGLGEMGLLRAFDYLSTSSGGGYVGSFWTAWRSRGPREGAFPEGPGKGGFAEPDEVRHVREFSNFLVPRLGLLSWDPGRLLVAALSSMVPSLLTAFSVILLVLVAWGVLARSLFATGVAASTAVMVGITAAVVLLPEVLFRRRREPTSPLAYTIGTVVALGVAGGLWSWLHSEWGSLPEGFDPSRRLPAPEEGKAAARWIFLLGPSLAWFGVAAVFSVRRWLTSRLISTDGRALARSALDRVHARVLFACAAWVVVSGLWFVGVEGYAWVEGFGSVGAATAALFAWARKKIGEQPNKPAGGRLTERLKPFAPQILAYVTIAAMVVCTVALLVALDASRPPAPTDDPGTLRFWTPVLAPAGAALLVALATLFLFDPIHVGLHAFYRGRLARAYPGASNEQARGADGRRRTDEQPGDDFPLSRATTERPLHLVCCAANDQAADALANLGRGAQSAVLSPVAFSVGGAWAPWSTQHRVPTLGSAITASGAAFNSLMGPKSIRLGPAVTFLMAAFNLRLGLWLPHPTRARVHGKKRRWMAGLPFFKEMFGIARAEGEDVHLSDGGHFDNTGVYELVRRHCRYVVLSDCGEDPDVAFDDFATMVRMVREDFGVDVRIDLAPLRPDPATGLARQPMVAGDIHYPDGDTGVLLLVKPTLVGNEPADVAQYRTRNTVFPHESTGDQFYDEAQWESYRRLGEHAAHSAFLQVANGLDRPGEGAAEGRVREYATQLFARARREWLPVPDGYAGRLAHLADDMAELDDLLREPGCRLLLGEVYREVGELDRRAKLQVGKIVGEDGAVEPGTEPAEAPPRRPELRDLAASLHVVRRALLVFEEVYRSEDLDRNYHNPVYLGVMNYFARWACAPVFRMWWPLLKSLHTQPFTRFVEAHFGLAAVGRAGEGRDRVLPDVEWEVEGFAMECWRAQGGEAPGEGREVASFTLRMQYRDFKPPYELQAAQVITSRADGVLVWDAAELFVPPGLWGIGIGEDFLRLLALRAPGRGISSLLVRVQVDPAGGAAAKKAAADLKQLYRLAGFAEIPAGRVEAGVRSLLPPAAGRVAPGEEREQWMLRALVPQEHAAPPQERAAQAPA